MCGMENLISSFLQSQHAHKRLFNAGSGAHPADWLDDFSPANSFAARGRISYPAMELRELIERSDCTSTHYCQVS